MCHEHALRKLTGNSSGKSPATFTLTRNNIGVVKLETAGHEQMRVTITPQISGAAGM
jgi:hypothetical protein